MEPTSWSVPPTNALKWRQWDEEFVVFNTASGDTHFLNGFAGEILRFVEARPATVDEILDYIAKSSDGEVHPELTQQIRALIEKFDESGLIEPIRP